MDDSTKALIHSLAKRGWSAQDFARNQLGYAAALCLGGMEPIREAFERYWGSVAKITSVLQSAGISHVILKTRRNYPYGDSNVDVFIQEADWLHVKAALCDAGWRMPSRAIILKQRLIEREKIKLPPVGDGLAPAHIYKAVSWRYQREVSFLNPAMVELVPLDTEAPRVAADYGRLLVPMPTRGADLLLHCAEIAFENYRITLGEVLYLVWLKGKVGADETRSVEALASERGATSAMRTVLARAADEYSPDPGSVTADWPRHLSIPDLLSSWGDRFTKQASRGKVPAAVEEWLGYALFGAMYRVKRNIFR